MAQPHSPFASALPATRRAQTYLTPEMAQLLSQQGGGQSEISGIDREIRQKQGDIQGPLPAVLNPGAPMQVAPHWTQALGNAANNLTTRVQTGRLRKTRDAKAQQLEKYERDIARVNAETSAKMRSEDEAHRGKVLGESIRANQAREADVAARREATEAQRQEMAAERKRDNDRAERHHRETQERLQSNQRATVNQRVNTEARHLGQENAESVRIGEALRDFDDLIVPYLQSGENIPGIGLGEGWQGYTGSLIRLGKDYAKGDNQAQNIYAAMRGFVNPILRADAGTAQTFTETQNILKRLGASGLEDESVLIEQYPAIRDAYNADMRRLRATYAPEVVERYESRFDRGMSPLRELPPLGEPGPGGGYGHGTNDVPGQGGFTSSRGHTFDVIQ